MRKALFLLLTIVMMGLFVACNDTNDESEEIEDTVTPVEVEKVKKGDLTVEQTTFGHVSPEKQTPVLVQQPGEITDVKVKSGDDVKKDERLGTIRTEMGSIAINAPIAGTVGQLSLAKNDFHTGEEPFAIVFDDETVAVQFTVTSTMKDKFKIDNTYKTTIDGKTYDATVKRIESLPNETGQYDIVAHIENDEGKITLGSVAEIATKEVLEKDALLVPTEAIVTEGDETYVFVKDEDLAKKVTVDVLESQTEQSAVDGKLKKKDEVIVTGQFLLTDGSDIEVVKDDE